MAVSGGFCVRFERSICPGVTNCVDRPKNTVEVCPAWAEAIGSGDLSHPALMETMVCGGPEAWEAVTSFCEAEMLTS